MTKRWKVLLAAGLVAVCVTYGLLRFWLREPGVVESDAAANVRASVLREIPVGATKEALLRFLRDRKLDTSFDELHHTYVFEAYREELFGLTVHNVTVRVFIADGKVAGLKVGEAFKP